MVTREEQISGALKKIERIKKYYPAEYDKIPKDQRETIEQLSTVTFDRRIRLYNNATGMIELFGSEQKQVKPLRDQDIVNAINTIQSLNTIDFGNKEENVALFIRIYNALYDADPSIIKRTRHDFTGWSADAIKKYVQENPEKSRAAIALEILNEHSLSNKYTTGPSIYTASVEPKGVTEACFIGRNGQLLDDVYSNAVVRQHDELSTLCIRIAKKIQLDNLGILNREFPEYEPILDKVLISMNHPAAPKSENDNGSTLSAVQQGFCNGANKLLDWMTKRNSAKHKAYYNQTEQPNPLRESRKPGVN